jgi:NAD(P)-dependent dehydrogenase (short-subunit alcohol dehydrogenase family)
VIAPYCSTDISICTDSRPTSRIPPGASKGLGLAITQILLSTFNAKIVAVSRSIPQELEKLRSSSDHKERVEVVQGDVGSDETSAHAVKVALERFGRIDGLVLNAGTIDPLGQYLETLLDPFDWTPSPQLTSTPFPPPGFTDSP